MTSDRFKLVLPSTQPAKDAKTLFNALHSTKGTWPIPGIDQWKFGYKADKVIVLVVIPCTKVRRTRRIGLFRFKDYITDEPQIQLAEEQLRQRWPASLPKPIVQNLGASDVALA